MIQKKMSNLIDSNKLKLNLDTTVQQNIGAIVTNHEEYFFINQVQLKVEAVCKNLGIRIDSKLSFQMQHVLNRLSVQCGIVSKLRHFAPANQLICFYKYNIRMLQL